MTEATQQGMETYFFRASATDFKKIPGSPIAYWLSTAFRDTFSRFKHLSSVSTSVVGQNTGDNDRFLRHWHEINFKCISFDCESENDTFIQKSKWYPYNKGGPYRKWFGNFSYVVNWQNGGKEVKDFAIERNNGRHWSRYIQNMEWQFHVGLTWSDVTSGNLSARYLPGGFLSDVSGHCAFFKEVNPETGLSIINSKFVSIASKIINPTIHFQAGNYRIIPYSEKIDSINTRKAINNLIQLATTDWNYQENSWDFKAIPLLHPDFRPPHLSATYRTLRAHWREMTLDMQRLEEENNRIIIDAYGLQDELTPDVPLDEITLTCNPHYRYGGDKSEEELEALLLADTMRELVSYAVGCMFGRYALDRPGLILANQGETYDDYLEQVPEPSFPADADNVIPVLEGGWFSDDIVERFRKFLRVAFGDTHYEANLAFVEQALNIKQKRNYSIRDYFVGEFYADHVRRYKKRPIYWMFSSPKGSFNALIYMHRYRPDTASVVLNDYLREFRTKLIARREHLDAVSISAGASQGEKTRALKEIESLRKVLDELDAYERENLYPLATRQLAIDLDDGVKVNYLKFGAALKKIPGLEAAEE